MRSITDYLEYVNKYLYYKQNSWQQYAGEKNKIPSSRCLLTELRCSHHCLVGAIISDSEQKEKSFGRNNYGRSISALIFLGRLSRAFNLFPHFAFSLFRMRTVIVRDIFYVDRNELTRPPSSGQSEYSMLKWTRSWTM
jgi:hypothetical protein